MKQSKICSRKNNVFRVGHVLVLKKQFYYEDVDKNRSIYYEIK